MLALLGKISEHAGSCCSVSGLPHLKSFCPFDPVLRSGFGADIRLLRSHILLNEAASCDCLVRMALSFETTAQHKGWRRQRKPESAMTNLAARQISS